MRRQRRPEEIPDLHKKCEKYGITYERACWLLTCPIIDVTEGRPKRITRNMSNYDKYHHIYRTRDAGFWYLKLRIGNHTLRQQLTRDEETSMRMRDEVIALMQKKLDAGELDKYFQDTPPSP